MRVVLPADISQGATLPLKSDASNRSAQRLIAIVAQLGLDLDTANPRYGRRDIDGNPATLETTCNIAARDFAHAMGTPIVGARANDQVAWLASIDARQRGWATISEHAAHGCAEEGMPVLVGWHSRGAGPGHIAIVMPGLEEPGTWIAQAGARCFSRGLLAAGFGDRAVSFFAHP